MAGDTPGTARKAQAPAAAAPLALYRRYRPATFAEVKGQEHVTEPLRQALRNGRVNHAYLFSGPRGCGKTSSARILARSLNCVQGPTPDPCGVCESCVALAPAGPGSIDVIEIDAASHGGVDDARDLRERAFYAPVSGRFKIYIIDEAHMVTREGFNALLKLVEEPPPHLKFVFATTEPEKVIATIRSRTHHYPFRLVPPAVLRELLEEILAAEGVRYEPSVLPLVVRAGAGSVRDALSVLDQLIAGAGDEGLVYDRTVALLGYSDDTLLDAMVDAFATGDGGAAFGTVDQVVQGGHDPRRFAADLLDRLRDLIILAAVPGAGKAGLLDVPADRLERMADQAERFGQAELARAAEILSDGLIQMRGTTSPRLLLELMCAQVLLPGAGTGERALLVRLERLEHRLEGAADTGTAPARAGSSRGGSAGQQKREPAAGAPARPGQPGPGQPGPGQPGPGQPGPSPAKPGQPGPGPAKPGQAEAGQPRSTPPAEESKDAEPGGSKAQPARPAASQRQSARPAQPGPPAQPASPAQPAPPAQPAAPPRAAGGPADVNVARERWPEILTAVLEKRRVAWMLLRSATVQSLESNVLTVGFAREGEVKGFASSGCDQVLAAALNSVLGINVRVRAMVASEAAVPSARAGAVTPGSAQASASQPPAAGEPAAGEPAAPGPSPSPKPPDRPSDGAAQPGERRGPAPDDASSGAPASAAEPPGGRRASAGSRSKRPSGGSPAGNAGRKGAAAGGRTAGNRAQPRQQAASSGDSAFADEEWPDDAGDQDSVSAGRDAPTGMELIQRQLGGRVIEEIEDA
jgi:DNA polymerase III subunit gamma/tau